MEAEFQISSAYNTGQNPICFSNFLCSTTGAGFRFKNRAF